MRRNSTSVDVVDGHRVRRMRGGKYAVDEPDGAGGFRGTVGLAVDWNSIHAEIDEHQRRGKCSIPTEEKP